jgi:hypothetical protein
MRFIQCTIPMNLLYIDVLWMTVCVLRCVFGDWVLLYFIGRYA